MSFNESNTVEAMIRDLLCGPQKVTPGTVLAETPAPYVTSGLAGRGIGWHFVPAAALPRQSQDLFVEEYVRDALLCLNAAIDAQMERAEEVIYKLRAIVLAVRGDGLARSAADGALTPAQESASLRVYRNCGIRIL